MLYTVSDKIKSKTNKCAHDFACLKTGVCGNKAKCTAESAFDKDMLVVKTQESFDISCPYHVTYSGGSGHMCTCPTHYAIYMKNKRMASYPQPILPQPRVRK